MTHRIHTDDLLPIVTHLDQARELIDILIWLRGTDLSNRRKTLICTALTAQLSAVEQSLATWGIALVHEDPEVDDSPDLGED